MSVVAGSGKCRPHPRDQRTHERNCPCGARITGQSYAELAMRYAAHRAAVHEGRG